MSARSEAGFSLMEVLIAMFIFALISVGATSALSQSFQSKAKMDERLAFMAELETARSLIQADFAHMTLRPMRSPYGGFEQYQLAGGTDSLIDFTRRGWSNPGGLSPRGETQRVNYAFEGGQLIRRALTQVNPAPNTPAQGRVLLEGLQSADMTFWSQTASALPGAPVASQEREQIFILPDGQGDRPHMITLSLEFENGDQLVQHFEVAL